jgi:hypothetical protein
MSEKKNLQDKGQHSAISLAIWALLWTAGSDPGSVAFLTPGSGMGKKIKIRIRDEHPGSEMRNNFLVKIL